MPPQRARQSSLSTRDALKNFYSRPRASATPPHRVVLLIYKAVKSRRVYPPCTGMPLRLRRRSPRGMATLYGTVTI